MKDWDALSDVTLKFSEGDDEDEDADNDEDALVRTDELTSPIDTAAAPEQNTTSDEIAMPTNQRCQTHDNETTDCPVDEITLTTITKKTQSPLFLVVLVLHMTSF